MSLISIHNLVSGRGPAAPEIPLAQDLIHAHGDAVGQVQAAAGVPHGHPDAVILMGGQQRFRQPGVLPPEDEVGPVRVSDVGVAPGRLGGEVIERAFVLGEEILQPVVIADVKVVPVIQPGVLELLVVDGKAHGAHQMQPTGRARAGAGHVAGVLRDAGFHKDDVQGRFLTHAAPSLRTRAAGTGGAAAAQTRRRSGCPAQRASSGWPAKRTPPRCPLRR